jgi:protease I
VPASLRVGRAGLPRPASRVKVDKTLEEADPDAYDGLLVLGGFINPDVIRQSADGRRFVRAFDQTGKPIAPCVMTHGFSHPPG